jgi:hypothetical protein
VSADGFGLGGDTDMKDCLASLEKLRDDAAEAALIRDLATQKAKRDMFNRLYHHYARLADEIERAMQDDRLSQ